MFWAEFLKGNYECGTKRLLKVMSSRSPCVAERLSLSTCLVGVHWDCVYAKDLTLSMCPELFFLPGVVVAVLCFLVEFLKLTHIEGTPTLPVHSATTISKDGLGRKGKMTNDMFTSQFM